MSKKVLMKHIAKIFFEDNLSLFVADCVNFLDCSLDFYFTTNLQYNRFLNTADAIVSKCGCSFVLIKVIARERFCRLKLENLLIIDGRQL